jgi:uncharacterized caspase-like protein
MQLENPGRRGMLRGAFAAGALFLPLPYAWVWAQSEGAMKLLRAPKVALVIGNGKYRDAPALKNAPNDAKAIGEALKASGFDVTLKLEAGREATLEAIRAYVHAMEQKKCVGLFYFAGHGMQLAWRNYLLPVDAVIDRIEDVGKQSVDIARLMEGLAKAANPMNVIILDACRENPFGKDFRVEQKGLSQMDAPNATLLAYATSPGNVASDGDGANGLYTENLLREIKVPEAKIEDVFKRVRLGVRRKSNGAQIPWESTSLEEDFWFLPPTELKKLSAAEDERLFKEELALWERIKASKDPAPLEDYLRRHPSGKFTELAQLQLETVLAAKGEKKIHIASSVGNPFTKGSAVANTAYRIGDTYTYRILDLKTRAEKRRGTATVESITESEIVFGNGMVTDLLGNTLKAADGRRFTPRQQFPLEYAVGRQWHSRFMASTRKGDDEGVVDLDLRIVGRERITVPAGTFDAFVLVGAGRTVFKNEFTETRWKRWMAPDQVRRAIAFEETLTAGTKTLISERGELDSFKQS